MMNVVTRGGALAPYLRGASVVVAGPRSASAPLVPAGPKAVVAEPPPRTTTSTAMQEALKGASIKLSSGPNAGFQVRYAHSDVKVPDFGDYRRSQTQNPKSNVDTQPIRNGYTYLVSAGCAITGIYATKTVVHYLVKYMAASADVLAMAKIEINLSDIPEGKSVAFKWRGKPLFVRHRTGKEISTEQAINASELRDPEPDSARVKDPKWLVVIGVCTHLGCVPIANAGDFGGYFCPCHGSHYDASGRIRKGPAPLNLEVPPYQFIGDQVVVG